MRIEERIARLEAVVEKILALPIMTTLAARDTEIFLRRIKEQAAEKKALLEQDDLSAADREEAQEALARCEYLVKPVLSLELDGNLPKEAPHEQTGSVE